MDILQIHVITLNVSVSACHANLGHNNVKGIKEMQRSIRSLGWDVNTT